MKKIDKIEENEKDQLLKTRCGRRVTITRQQKKIQRNDPV